MNKMIKVPDNITYLSKWAGFKLPNGVFNKVVTGCGGTTVALESNDKYIIAVPRIALGKCKHEQYPDTLFVKGGVNVDDIKKYLNESKLPKIITTFDSISKVSEAIENKSKWKVLVDEFQLILSDAGFKGDTVLNFMSVVKEFNYVTYMSATPILDKYLKDIDDFKHLDYTELNWGDKLSKYNVNKIQTEHPLTLARDIVLNYCKGKYPVITKNKEEYKSTEAIFFFNSVEAICRIIKQTNIKPTDITLFIGDSERNRKCIEKLDRKMKYNKSNGFINRINIVNKKDSSNTTKFTFCTSTAFAGVDFYSKSAKTYIVSDCNDYFTTIDTQTELIQIMGRQRLNTNPFKYEVELIYNKGIRLDEYNKETDDKCLGNAKECCDIINGSSEVNKKTFLDGIESVKYKKGNEYLKYVVYDEKNEKLKINYYTAIQRQMCRDINKYQRENGIAVLNNKNINSTTEEYIETKELKKESFHAKFEGIAKEYAERVNQLLLDKRKDLTEEQKKINDEWHIGEGVLEYDETLKKLNEIKFKDKSVGEYFNNECFGKTLEDRAKKIKALNYKQKNLDNYINDVKMSGAIQSSLRKKENLGLENKKPVKEVKEILTNIYKELGVNKNAKAADIVLYGYKINSRKAERDNFSGECREVISYKI